jgi:hypothetical protein
MGRWAQVYFTNAPEKREEAVLELLRELEARKSEYIPPESQAIPSPQPRSVGTVDSGLGEQVRCRTCGHDNPSKHQFCGMCGSQLAATAPEQVKGKSFDGAGAEKELAEDPELGQADADFGASIDEETAGSPDEPCDAPYDLSLYRSLRPEEPGEDLDYDDSPSFRYRYYIGALLAILILVLGYLAWRGAQANPRAQGTPPPPPPAATQSAAPASSTAPASAPARPLHGVEAQSALLGTKTGEPSTAKSAEIPKPVKATAALGHTLPSTVRPGAASNNGHKGSAGNGAEEYAAAERYLNSEPRDSAQAAKWLWKAMAKHNGPAALALADLYLKGDGVAKNCDQARVLLDSAARRDLAGAGERLRNLQAFGCQ